MNTQPADFFFRSRRLWSWLVRAWQLGVFAAIVITLHGWANGPNHFAQDIVSIDKVSAGNPSTSLATRSWIIDYRRTSLATGQEISGRIEVAERDMFTAIRKTNLATPPGTQTMLRVPVEADEPTAKFAFNRQVRHGALLLSLLLVLRWHVRRHPNPFGTAAVVQLLAVAIGICGLWLFTLPQGVE